MEARQHLESLRQRVAPSMTTEYFQYYEDKYLGIINPKLREAPPLPEEIKTGSGALAADSDEAKVVIMGLFGNMKRGMGYGG